MDKIEAMARGVHTCGLLLEGDECMKAAQAAHDAYHEWLAANGFAVVPVEPTEGMYQAAENANPLAFTHNPWTRIDEIWNPMIEAAKQEGGA